MHLSTYRSLGAELLVIVGQRETKVAEYHHAHAFGFPILIDPDRTVIKRYGVYHHLGLTAFNIARPATFIIDRAQRLRFIHISKNQTDRPDHTKLVAELQKLHPPQPMSPRQGADAPPGDPALQ